MSSVWVLTLEDIGYDRNSVQTLGIFKEKPTPEKINEIVCNPYLDCTTLAETLCVYCEGFYYDLEEVRLIE